MSDSSNGDPRPTDPSHTAPDVPVEATSTGVDPTAPAAGESSPRTGLAARLRDRTRGTSAPVRWVAAGVLALLLLVGVAAAGFAVGNSFDGGRDGRGQSGNVRGGSEDAERGHRSEHRSGDDRSDDRGDDQSDDQSDDQNDDQSDGTDPTPSTTPVPTPAPTPSTGQ